MTQDGYELWIQLDKSSSSRHYWSLLLAEGNSHPERVNQEHVGHVPRHTALTHNSANSYTQNIEIIGFPSSDGVYPPALRQIPSSSSPIALIQVGEISYRDLARLTAVLENDVGPVTSTSSRRRWVLAALQRLREAKIVDTPPLDDSSERAVVKQGVIGAAAYEVVRFVYNI